MRKPPARSAIAFRFLLPLGATMALSIAPLVVATPAAQYAGWTIPEGATSEKSPIAASAATLKKGKSLFGSNCEKCHGPLGKGDGLDSDKARPAADLTDEFRFDINPDGILYYKIMNGRPPDMPAFKSRLSKDEAWTLVEYVKSLRKPQ